MVSLIARFAGDVVVTLIVVCTLVVVTLIVVCILVVVIG